MHKLARGAIAGTMATLPMTLVMTYLFRKLPSEQRYPLPPRLIMESLSRRLGLRTAISDARLMHATMLAHFAYGAVTGAPYPILETHLQQRRATLVFGAVYGVGIWAASYLGWIPAVHILKPASQHPARRNALMLTAHLVWGAALAKTSSALPRWLDSEAASASVESCSTMQARDGRSLLAWRPNSRVTCNRLMHSTQSTL